MSKTNTVRIADVIAADRVVDLISSKKDNVLKELIQVLSISKAVSNKLDFYKAVVEREAAGSTGIGMGVAIPHARALCVSKPVIALGRKLEGVDFESPDGQLCSIVVLIGVPEDASEALLRLLARTVLVFKSHKFRKRILEAKSKTEIVALLKEK